MLVIGRRSSGGLVKHGSRRERVRCMPQIGSNIYAIGMITALRDYVRLLRAIPMLTLSSHHHHHPSLLRTVPRSSPLSVSFSACVCLCQSPFSMTSRINGKSGLLNDRSRDTRIVSVAHATSASTFFRFFSLITCRFAPRGLLDYFPRGENTRSREFVRAEFFDRFVVHEILQRLVATNRKPHPTDHLVACYDRCFIIFDFFS